MNTLSYLLLLSFPIWVLISRRIFPNNKITPFFVPIIFLNQHVRTKVALKTGIAYLVICAWLNAILLQISHSWSLQHRFAFAVSLMLYFPMPLMFLKGFILTSISFVSLLKKTRHIYKDIHLLPFYDGEYEPANCLSRLRMYGLINFVSWLCVFLLFLIDILFVISLPPELYFTIALVIIASAAVYIASFYRMMYYLVLSATSMKESGTKYFSFTLYDIFVPIKLWTASLDLIKKHKLAPEKYSKYIVKIGRYY